ncbi:uncharacterized protein CANTADRAFT_47732 [Suhomyces tanzawaensis NRRL Y-17324]|uniref:PH domain-containing protein n=1 Tax=Suhomyces tanzawaensis NRRL Y-17324 TaxID=984487 RepID=A0A1E4SLY9_9ASCO|nr:uncharacterized protein CANTADRAFT_47732 [Suhomyces tanzawaensis NRRL Y-17324]ODV80539.1 hypothetical protein CANTADRAFT_47732 [Suhomyces tanzawaensis NRRL Y-17324]
MPSDELHIPKHSFTAFRLTYSTAHVVSESSRCVFLGSIPDIWRDDRGPDLLTTITKHAKGQVKKNFRSASTLIGTSIRRATSRFDSNEDLEGTRRSKINIEMPQPMEKAELAEQANTDISWAEKEHHRFTRRLRSLASASRNIAHDTKRIRKRIYRNILKEYKEGEILRLDKFLILTKVLHNIKKVSTFNENEFCDSRIYSQWNEYICVLRRTSNPTNPLSIELYELHNNIDNRKPDISFALSPEVGAFLYSDSDKSFCLTVPKDNNVYVYIFKAHSQIVAIRSLFFITKLGQRISYQYNVSIPDLGLKLDVEVPFSEIRKAFESRPFLSLCELEKGYCVSSSPILQYLKTKVIEAVQSYRIPQFDKWIQQLEWPWFCFKQYDSLDWVMNNSQVFLMNYSILKNSYQLELRNLDSGYFLANLDGKLMKEPYPIEGFLFRMTNTSGRDKSFMRSFHKMLYFYSCDKILFFTKYYRGAPPATDSNLDHSNVECVHEYNPYPLDAQEHITWLKNESFDKYDQAALTEFKRRSQQVVKAEAMLDMTLIADIRSISLDKISKTQRMVFCLYWYSSAELINEEDIVDSAFEIEMSNGNILRLQAPNRNVRDEWVLRISQLRQYWISKTYDDLERVMAVRVRNQQSLRISEYIDSNIKQELGTSEYQFGVADPLIHNINSLAMSRSVTMSGYLYEKGKKHSNFNQYYVVLCPGFLVLYSVFQRSKLSGQWKKNPLYEHYFTIPIAECYLYSGITTSIDLLQEHREVDPRNPSRRALPRIYPDGWKSSEEEHTRCFTLWFGKKRQIKEQQLHYSKGTNSKNDDENHLEMNPGISTMIKRLGFTGKSMVFMARSRQERELWTSSIMAEIDRFTTT